MPFTYSETFRVRFYECDQYEHVNNAIYLRYLQETARNACAAAGLDRSQLARLDVREWMHSIDIEYLIPLYYGEAVEIVFRPLGVQNNLFYQEFEFHKTTHGELAARALCATGFLMDENEETAPVPDEFFTAFFPTGELVRAADPAPFPNFPPPPPGTYKVQRRVDWLDINAHSQVDHPTLLAYLEDCGRQVVAAHRWPMERMLTEGFAILLRRNQIEYTCPANFDDVLEIATWASNVRRATATRHYSVTRARDRKPIARVHALGVWVNLATGQPMRISPELLADFAANIVS